MLVVTLPTCSVEIERYSTGCNQVSLCYLKVYAVLTAHSFINHQSICLGESLLTKIGMQNTMMTRRRLITTPTTDKFKFIFSSHQLYRTQLLPFVLIFKPTLIQTSNLGQPPMEKRTTILWEVPTKVPRRTVVPLDFGKLFHIYNNNNNN